MLISLFCDGYDYEDEKDFPSVLRETCLDIPSELIYSLQFTIPDLKLNGRLQEKNHTCLKLV
jgi:hypothetical protein